MLTGSKFSTTPRDHPRVMAVETWSRDARKEGRAPEITAKIWQVGIDKVDEYFAYAR